MQQFRCFFMEPENESGKNYEYISIKAIMPDDPHGKSLNETKAQLNVARFTVIRYKKKLRDAKIMSYSSLLALNDDEFIRAMYGAKAVVEKKPSKTTVHIGKDNPNHTKKALYDADF